mmetsp:Transcript_19563/g.50070  ORF Transcript_19563/g.50070 Transcript_19563/m.50070 type:complete len:469 (+) Transcript_19563:139-1545(+)
MAVSLLPCLNRSFACSRHSLAFSSLPSNGSWRASPSSPSSAQVHRIQMGAASHSRRRGSAFILALLISPALRMASFRPSCVSGMSPLPSRPSLASSSSSSLSSSSSSSLLSSTGTCLRFQMYCPCPGLSAFSMACCRAVSFSSVDGMEPKIWAKGHPPSASASASAARSASVMLLSRMYFSTMDTGCFLAGASGMPNMAAKGQLDAAAAAASAAWCGAAVNALAAHSSGSPAGSGSALGLGPGVAPPNMAAKGQVEASPPAPWPPLGAASSPPAAAGAASKAPSLSIAPNMALKGQPSLASLPALSATIPFIFSISAGDSLAIIAAAPFKSCLENSCFMAAIMRSRRSFASPSPSSSRTVAAISAIVASLRCLCVASSSSIMAASSSSSLLSESHSAASAFHFSTMSGRASAAAIIIANGHFPGSPPSGCPAGLPADESISTSPTRACQGTVQHSRLRAEAPFSLGRI